MGNYVRAGTDITVVGDNGDKSQIQAKKEVTLVAVAGNILLSSSFGDGDQFGEVQAEENNTFTAGNDITLRTGINGAKLEVKKFSVFDAGGNISILPGAGTFCRIESATGPPTPGTDLWSDFDNVFTTPSCLLF